ncbi:MAG: hypothetical protein R3F49_02465 [Planctomycetota bacterium]
MEEARLDSKLNEELTDAVRRWGRPTTPRELAARGVQRLHSISLSRVAALLEKAVNRTLIRRTLEGLPDDALSLSSSAREEFVRLALGTDASEAARINERASSTLVRLRGELARRRAALEVEAEVPHAVHDLRQTGAALERVRELFALHGGDREVPLALERDVLRVVEGAFDDLLAREREARQREHRREADLLERRVAKLQALLVQSESELQRARGARGAEVGVPSMYDTVQGLSEDDPSHESKGALLSAIFVANLELRR